MNIAIIGAGISGLYSAYKLQNLSTINSITIFEKSSRIGGRVKTIKYHTTNIEAGAGRISSKHKRVLELAKELKLDLIKFPKSQTPLYYENGVQKERLPLLEHKPNTDKITFEDWLLQKHTTKYVSSLISQIGYDSVLKTNAKDAYKEIKAVSHNCFYSIKGGLSTIIDSLYKNLNAKVKIYKNHKIDSIPELLQKYDHIIIAVTAPDLWKLNINTGSIIPHPLTRIYAYFSDTSFTNNQRMTCNTSIRQCIPITQNIVMASYSTDKYAEYWNKQKELSTKLKDELEIAYGIKDIPEPQYIRKFYWKTGVHSLGVGSKEVTHTYDKRRNKARNKRRFNKKK